jgi:hypothetical protein
LTLVGLVIRRSYNILPAVRFAVLAAVIVIVISPLAALLIATVKVFAVDE